MFNNSIRRFYNITDVELNLGSGGAKIAVDAIGGRDYEVVKQAFGSEGDLQLVWDENPLPIKLISFNATTTSIPASVTSVTLNPANSTIKGVTIFNNSTDTLYIKLGATASTSDFTVRVISMGYYEVPFGYCNVIDGIWSGTNGAALITEIT